MLIQALNGLVYGSFLYILSVGLVLLFGLRQVINFAHGSLFMFGAYIAYQTSLLMGFWAGLVASVAVLAILGVVLDRLLFNPLSKEDPIVTLLVTFGLLLLLEDGARTIWGSNYVSLPAPALLDGTVIISGVQFPVYRLFVVAVALAVALGLALWLRFTKVGLYVRASSVDPVTTAMQGVDTERLSALVVAIGVGLAGLSGAIAGPLIALSPSVGGTIIIDCFIVVVTGGLTSFTGVFIAALVIGQFQNLGVVYMPELASVIPLIIMALVLLIRPQIAEVHK